MGKSERKWTGGWVNTVTLQSKGRCKILKCTHLLQWALLIPIHMHFDIWGRFQSFLQHSSIFRPCCVWGVLQTRTEHLCFPMLQSNYQVVILFMLSHLVTLWVWTNHLSNLLGFSMDLVRGFVHELLSGVSAQVLGHRRRRKTFSGSSQHSL